MPPKMRVEVAQPLSRLKGKLSNSAKKYKSVSFLEWIRKIPKLSAVRKVPETIQFQALGIIETLGSIISHGTS